MALSGHYVIDAAGVSQNAIHLSLDQEKIVKKFGTPESFKLMIKIEYVNFVREVTRIEIWNYYSLKTSLAFIDGNFEAEEEIEDVPDWTLFPIIYRPEQFANEMSLEEVKKKIIGDKPFETMGVPKDLLPDAQLIGFEQIVLGFEQEKLTYVETIPLFPKEGKRNSNEVK